MNKLATFVSAISHPIFLPFWMFVILMTSGIVKTSFIRVDVCLAIIFLVTVSMPMLILLFLKKIKIIKSLTMERRDDRFIPLLLMIASLYITIRFFKDINMLAIYNFYLTCNATLCVIVFWINMYWKISMHGIGWGAYSATLLILTTISAEIFLTHFILSIIASGIICTARLYLKSHNEPQVYAGFIVGFIVVFALYQLTINS